MDNQPKPKIVKFKRGVNLIVGLYRFKKDGKYKEKQHWRCTIVGQGCRGRVHTVGEGDELQVVHRTEHNHDDSTIISDFESSIIPTLRHHFPNTQHHSCYFHHTQAIWRQVQRLGLQAEYEEDQCFIRRSARSLMALAFLPEDKITPTFEHLQQLPEVQNNPKLIQLYEYSLRTWMTGPFPMDMWNVHQATTRTNNMVEGWHSKLNKYVRRLHPNIHQLIKELQKEQAMTQLTLQRARLGGAPPARRQKYVRIDQQVETMTTNYTENRLTELEYLAGLRRVIHHY